MEICLRRCCPTKHFDHNNSGTISADPTDPPSCSAERFDDNKSRTIQSLLNSISQRPRNNYLIFFFAERLNNSPKSDPPSALT